MVLHGVPPYGLVYGSSGTVHVVGGELDPIPPLVQVREPIASICADSSRLTQPIRHSTATLRILAYAVSKSKLCIPV
jgi:hypothetical protein